MKENMQKLIEELKEKEFIFVNGFPNVGKTKLINTLKQRKEFENYDFELSTDYYNDKEKIFSLELDKPKFIEIKSVKDIDFLSTKAKNPEKVIRNVWYNGIIINLNIKGHEITNSIGNDFYAYAYCKKVITIENLTVGVYITDMMWLKQSKILFNNIH